MITVRVYHALNPGTDHGAHITLHERDFTSVYQQKFDTEDGDVLWLDLVEKMQDHKIEGKRATTMGDVFEIIFHNSVHGSLFLSLIHI